MTPLSWLTVRRKKSFIFEFPKSTAMLNPFDAKSEFTVEKDEKTDVYEKSLKISWINYPSRISS